MRKKHDRQKGKVKISGWTKRMLGLELTTTSENYRNTFKKNLTDWDRDWENVFIGFRGGGGRQISYFHGGQIDRWGGRT